jgi:hypothetical protein
LRRRIGNAIGDAEDNVPDRELGRAAISRIMGLDDRQAIGMNLQPPMVVAIFKGAALREILRKLWA